MSSGTQLESFRSETWAQVSLMLIPMFFSLLDAACLQGTSRFLKGICELEMRLSGKGLA